ncbi:hypothetical protein TNCV_3757151 [Trichonephila clavipes]|nr:hypothetical protein TNCV_3757151 [Trichonephila clavipes]
MNEAKIEIKMAPHRPKKSAPVEYTTDEEDMILYDVEDEFESNPDYEKKRWKNILQAIVTLTPTRHRNSAKIGSCANNPNTHLPRQCSVPRVDENDGRIELQINFPPTVQSRSADPQCLPAVLRGQGQRFGSNEEVIAEVEAYFESKNKSFYEKDISPPGTKGCTKDVYVSIKTY